VDPLKRVEPCQIERIDALELRLLDTHMQLMHARLFGKERHVMGGPNYKPKTLMLPAICEAMVLHFDAKIQGSMHTQRSWMHLSSCRILQDDRIDDFIRACYIRLIEIADPAQAYLKLLPCFYLSKVVFVYALFVQPIYRSLEADTADHLHHATYRQLGDPSIDHGREGHVREPCGQGQDLDIVRKARTVCPTAYIKRASIAIQD
jgi:hypothetical protein